MDYPGNRFYFKKNKYFNYPFKYNMSGLDIKHDGVQWSQTLVKMEVEGSRNAREALAKKGTEAIKSPGEFQYKFELRPAYTITGVRKGSPGDIAGLQEGDQVISVKNIPTAQLTLEHIVQILSLKEDKVINIEVKRDSVLLRKQVVLKDPIPYRED
jgi:S1-C subfamily serine protease